MRILALGQIPGASDSDSKTEGAHHSWHRKLEYSS